ncbi:hypothetical protein [Aquimarina litoralis]|uniref:hypothetical protein n=1 Tax=Aquimarina litoralis TaxID=584605 RepID=UPI001C5874B6|nr:hypothetical protein [Aquimarina litoralis]MBW1299038.1 hypothetical protein [Aquimarina litoralis]
MENKLIRYIKFGLLCFGISLILSSCENDESDFEETFQTNKKSQFKTYSISKTKILSNLNLNNRLKSIEGYLKLKSNNKSAIPSNLDFTVVTDYASYIESNEGAFHSYTFPIIRENDNGLTENMVLTIQDDGSYKALLISYNLTQHELFDIKNNMDIDLTDKVTIEEINDNNLINDVLQNKTLNCSNDWIEICIEQACSVDGCWDPAYTTWDCNTTYVYNCEQVLDCTGCNGDTLNNNPFNTSSGLGNGGNGGTLTNPVNKEILQWQQFTNSLNRSSNNLLQNNLTINIQISQYLKSNNYSNEAMEFARNAISVILEIEDNPFKLIEIDCNQIENWQILAQHTAPQSVQNKINNLPNSWANDFEIQSINDAKGTMVNLDYFSVNVSELPNNPNTNSSFTADEFLNYMRLNFNNFVEGSTFEPYCEIASMCQSETNLWNSNDPLGSIIYIDIPFDDGVVVCTEFTNSYWYFMTMNAPYAGNHPVSGTRQFGYEENSNGSYNFYVRGVDRFDSNIIENTSFGLDGFDNAFKGADDLWKSFQTKTRDFVNSNGGNSTIIPPTKNRPDWNKVQQVLKGELAVSELGCN